MILDQLGFLGWRFERILVALEVDELALGHVECARATSPTRLHLARTHRALDQALTPGHTEDAMDKLNAWGRWFVRFFALPIAALNVVVAYLGYADGRTSTVVVSTFAAVVMLVGWFQSRRRAANSG